MIDNKQVAQMKHDGAVLGTVLHKDMVITASLDKTVRVWETRTGKLLHTLTHLGGCVNVDINPDKTLLAVAHHGGVTLWCLETFTNLGQAELGRVTDVRFLNNKRIIAGLYNGQVYLIDRPKLINTTPDTILL